MINGYCQFLIEGMAAQDPLRQYAELIAQAGERAAALTKQLLAFSRKRVRQPRVLNLNDLVSEVDVLLRRLIGDDIELVTRLASDLHFVKVHPGQLEQVMMNLAVNASDAMPAGDQVHEAAAKFAPGERR